MAIESFTNEYSFLSNFYPSSIQYYGIEYPTVEHAYQAAKTHSISLRQEVALLDSPGKAKRAGKKLPLRDDWEDIKIDVMRLLLEKKFKSYPDLMQKLIDTNPQELIEGNTWGDRFWGQCPIGNGKNTLGKLLMSIRTQNIHFS